MRRFQILVLSCLALLLAGCGGLNYPEDVQAEFQRILDAVSAGEWEYIQANLADDIPRDGFDEVAAQIDFATGQQPFTEARAVNWFAAQSVGSSTYQTQYLLTYPDRVLLLHVTLVKSEGRFSISGFHVSDAPEGAGSDEIPPFTLEGKPTSQLVILGIAIFNPLFMLFTCITAIRTRKRHGRPWLWGILSLIGVGQLSIVWETGAQTIQLLAIGLLGAGVHTVLVDPGWVLQVYFPLFAILFWFKLMTLREED